MPYRRLSLVGVLVIAALITSAAPAAPATPEAHVGPVPRLVEIDAGDGTLIVVRAADAEARIAELRARQLHPEQDSALRSVHGRLPAVEPLHATMSALPRALRFTPALTPIAARNDRQGRVIGNDDRKAVKKTKRYPASATTYIFITTAGGSGGLCSGALVGAANLVITAGHCIYSASDGEFFADWFIAPGAKNANKLPFGACSWKEVIVHKNWRKKGLPKFDVGAIVLDCNVGDRTGFLGARKASGNGFIGGQHVIHQYPGDKPRATQWRDQGPWSFTGDQRAFYTIDTAGGSSGSPVMQEQGDNTYNTNATHAYGGTTHNSGATWWNGTWKVLKRGLKAAK
jgi:glutamyl endopeptidase